MFLKILIIIFLVIIINLLGFEYFKSYERINDVLLLDRKLNLKFMIQSGIKDYNLEKKYNNILRGSVKKVKTLVLYAYYESGQNSILQLQYYLRNGVLMHNLIEYVVVIQGECSYCQSQEFKEKQQQNNLKVIYKMNIGQDFGGYSAALMSVEDVSIYKYFMLINSSCIGPFIPKYLIDQKQDWPNIFTSLLNDQTKLVGTSISTDGPLHVQSFCVAFDYIALNIFLKNKIFMHAAPSKLFLIWNMEHSMTRIILKKNYSVNTLLQQYQKTNWTQEYNQGSLQTKFNQGLSPTYNQRYGSSNYDLDPFEVLFYKNAGAQRMSIDKQHIRLCPQNICSTDDLIQYMIDDNYNYQIDI